MAGVRPKLQGPGEDIRDFVIREEGDRGLPGFVNLIGIESPGLTASPSIAKLVAAIVDGIL
jgi:L-2-hydroxyglutarate oxidase LhgO